MPEILLYVGNSKGFGQFQMRSQQSPHKTLPKPAMSKRKSGKCFIMFQNYMVSLNELNDAFRSLTHS